MRPRLLTDEMIMAAIRDLAAVGKVTGVAVRSLLLQRYGSKGSVARIYRQISLLRQTAAVPRRPPPITAEPRSITEALERAQLAEEREQSHQLRWARETESLRAQLVEAQQAAREAHDLRLRVAQLRQALAAAQARIAALQPARTGLSEENPSADTHADT